MVKQNSGEKVFIGIDKWGEEYLGIYKENIGDDDKYCIATHNIKSKNLIYLKDEKVIQKYIELNYNLKKTIKYFIKNPIKENLGFSYIQDSKKTYKITFEVIDCLD